MAGEAATPGSNWVDIMGAAVSSASASLPVNRVSVSDIGKAATIGALSVGASTATVVAAAAITRRTAPALAMGLQVAAAVGVGAVAGSALLLGHTMTDGGAATLPNAWVRGAVIGGVAGAALSPLAASMLKPSLLENTAGLKRIAGWAPKGLVLGLTIGGLAAVGYNLLTRPKEVAKSEVGS